MNRQRGARAMLMPTIIMAVVAVILIIIGYTRGGGEHILGVKSAGSLLLQVAPLLILGFIVAGMIQVLIPAEVVSNWIGAGSGFKGILIGSLAGALTPGGPYTSLPLTLGFMRAGAGIGTLTAFITGWALLQLSRLPFEVSIMGWKFTAIRLACTFVFPPIAGLIAGKIFSGVSLNLPG